MSPELSLTQRVRLKRAVESQAFRNGKKLRLRKGRLPRQNQPDAIRLAYFRKLRAITNRMRALVKERVLPLLKELLPQGENDSFSTATHTHTDADKEHDAARVRAAVRGVAKVVVGEVSTARIKRLAEETARATSAKQKAELNKQIRAAVGVEVELAEPWLTPMVERFTRDNAALIVDVPKAYMERVEAEAVTAIREGTRWEVIAKKIELSGKVSESRARLIAVDQTGKIFSQINEARQTALGITHYIWRCFHPDTPVSAVGAKFVSRREWSGPMIRITGEQGHAFAVTPEHKILTARGWIEAGALNAGDYLVSHGGEIEDTIARGATPLSDARAGQDECPLMPNVNHVPTKISEVFTAARNSLLRSGHGTARGVVNLDCEITNGNVEIVSLDCGLRRNLESALPEGHRKILLECSDFSLETLARASVSEQGDIGPGDADALGRPEGRFPPLLSRPLPLDADKAGGRSGAALNPVANHHGVHGGLSASVLPREGVGAHPLPVILRYERCLSINVFSFTGHVYDLTTDGGWLFADSVVAHNCSNDNRVRDTHQERDGERFSWDEPPGDLSDPGDGGHPGTPVRCRCEAEPDLSEILGNL